MGYLRTLLAITVVFAHSYGEVFVGGQLAVQIFYMISGFLIAHVLRTNPAYAEPLRFYVNRALRIYPAYFAVALATLMYVLIANPSMLDIYRRIPATAALFAGISNVTVFGQDWVMFSGVSEGHLRFFTNFRQSDPQLWNALLVPQAWTLGVELTFYVVAPFVLRRPGITVVLLLASCAVRAVTWRLGIGKVDPWTYRFFPSELALFLLGALSNRYALPLWHRVIPTAKRHFVSTLGVVYLLLLCIGFKKVPAADAAKTTLLLVSCTALLPLAFMFQRGSRVDKWIGELSYPVYIVHMLVIWTMGAALSAMGLSLGRRSTTALVVVASCVAAIALTYLVITPTERLRQRIRSKRTAT